MLNMTAKKSTTSSIRTLFVRMILWCALHKTFYALLEISLVSDVVITYCERTQLKYIYYTSNINDA